MTKPHIPPGRRALVAGRTGSGKSVLGNWLLKNSPGNWVVLNPKHTAAYKHLPDSVVTNSLDIAKVSKLIEKYQFVVINPESREANPDTMDDFIMALHESWKNVGLCCDELYALHKGNGTAGAGLLGWITRGRELRQSFLGLTQRPAFLSKFLFSESDYICGMKLKLAEDKKRMAELTGRAEFSKELPAHYWLWYNVGADSLDYFKPVPIK